MEQRSDVTVTYLYGLGRIAYRESTAEWRYYLADGLGNVRAEVSAAGVLLTVRRFSPFGEPLQGGDGGTPFGYTGEQWDGQTQLLYLRARYYSPTLGRFISKDPFPGFVQLPQTLHSYQYVGNNAPNFVDPSGEQPPVDLFIVVAGRVGSEVIAQKIPSLERTRRDQIGGQIVTDLQKAVSQESAKRGIDPIIVNAILRHEGSAFERRLLTISPLMKPGVIANDAEYIQTLLQGDTASIGPGQMQLRRARELEKLGYVTARANDYERAWTLLNEETSVEYIAGMVQYLSDQLQETFPCFRNLDAETQTRLILIGYNRGWEVEVLEESKWEDEGLKGRIKTLGFRGVVEEFRYDNQTLDEYLRWSKRQ